MNKNIIFALDLFRYTSTMTAKQRRRIRFIWKFCDVHLFSVPSADLFLRLSIAVLTLSVTRNKSGYPKQDVSLLLSLPIFAQSFFTLLLTDEEENTTRGNDDYVALRICHNPFPLSILFSVHISPGLSIIDIYNLSLFLRRTFFFK